MIDHNRQWTSLELLLSLSARLKPFRLLIGDAKNCEKQRFTAFYYSAMEIAPFKIFTFVRN